MGGGIGILNGVIIAIGIVIAGSGYYRMRMAWRRYSFLKGREDNAQRYETWRGGLRSEPGKTGADVEMAMLRTRARVSGLIVAAGFAVLIAGFLIPLPF